MSDLNETITAHIQEREDELLDLVTDLVKARSDKGNEKAAQEVVIDELETLEIEPDVWVPDVEQLRDHPAYFDTATYEDYGYDDRPNVAGTIDGTGDGRSLTLSGHVDVVSVDDPDKWTYDPWDTTIEDGRIYGRGTTDMKGGVAANIFAAKTLHDLGIELNGDLTIQTTIDEEAGGTGGVLSALERGYQPDAAIITEPYLIPNIGVASAGVMYFRVTVTGKAAHAARGFQGTNSAVKAATLIQALDELDQQRKADISFEPAVKQYPNAEGSVTNLNIGVVDAGDWPSTVPSKTVLECRIGWPPGETREEVREQVESVIADVTEDDSWLSEHPPELEWYGWSAEPHEVDPSEEIVQLAKEYAEATTGQTGSFVGGLAGLDERFYNHYYDIPCPSVGPRGDNIHGADEYAEIDSLVQTAQTVALAAVDWCGVAEQ